MRDLDRQLGASQYNRNYYNYSYDSKKRPRKKKNKSVSLGFCWAFGFFVCLTFGLASFLMFSAGHFNFSSGSEINPAWGGSEGSDTTITGNLIKVEITELEGAQTPKNNNLYVYTQNSLNEEIGPLPKYLSDYQSIILSVHEDGTTMPENEDEDEEIPINNEELPAEKPVQKQPVLVENATLWREHVVKNGETLSDIAMAHGNITAQDILRANGLKDANRLSENINS